MGRYAYIKLEYPNIIHAIELKRIAFASEYKLAPSINDRKQIIFKAQKYLINTLIDNIFPAWYGTPWSFYGDTEYPMSGSIACGAFIENVLKNVGFQIDNKLSMQPSEYIIKNLVENENIKRFFNVPFDKFIATVQSLGNGIYIVGLDRHVGFLYIRNKKIRFIHSQAYLFVIPQIPVLSISLRKSKYRVVGKLFDFDMVEKWLLKRKFSLRYDYFKKG